MVCPFVGVTENARGLPVIVAHQEHAAASASSPDVGAAIFRMKVERWPRTFPANLSSQKELGV